MARRQPTLRLVRDKLKDAEEAESTHQKVIELLRAVLLLEDHLVDLSGDAILQKEEESKAITVEPLMVRPFYQRGNYDMVQLRYPIRDAHGKIVEYKSIMLKVEPDALHSTPPGYEDVHYLLRPKNDPRSTGSCVDCPYYEKGQKHGQTAKNKS